MFKQSSAILIVALAATTCLAQTQPSHTTTKKPATAAPNTNTPTKVTGAPTKTASGLEYWDIKVGTGPTAATRQKVKATTQAGAHPGRNSRHWSAESPTRTRAAPAKAARWRTEGTAGTSDAQ